MTDKKILFITVCYNNLQSTKEYIESYLALSDLDLSMLVVVDNSDIKSQELEDFILKNRGDICYLRQEKNDGYMAACNYAYSTYKDHDYTCVIYSNNDLIFNSKDCIKSILKAFESPEIGVIAPSVLDSNSGKQLNPFLHHRPSKKSLLKLKLIHLNFFTYKTIHSIYWLLQRLNFLKKRNNEQCLSGNIYATHGSIFIIRSSLINENLLDDKYFLYAEEVTVAERCAEKNYFITLFHDIKIIHNSHATTGSSISKKIFEFKRDAIHYILKKYNWE